MHQSQDFGVFNNENLSPKAWEATMDADEVRWCITHIRTEIESNPYDYACADSYRAARAWKSSQVRRFKKLRTCCGSREWVAYRWSWRKLRFDKYILGFNFGH